MSLRCSVQVMIGNGTLGAYGYEDFAVDFSNYKTTLYMVGTDGIDRLIAEMNVEETYLPVGPRGAISCLGTVKGPNGPAEEIWNIVLQDESSR